MYRFLICLLLLMPATINASTLKGVVIDSFSDKPIVGVAVFLVGTNLGAMTDSEGKFEIKNINISVFDVKATRIGYHAKTLKDIKLYSDSTKNLKIGLLDISKEEILSLSLLIPKSIFEYPLNIKLYSYVCGGINLINYREIHEILEQEYKYIVNDVSLDYYYFISICKDSIIPVMTIDHIGMKYNHNAIINLDEIFKSDKLKDKYIKLDSNLIHYEAIK